MPLEGGIKMEMTDNVKQKLLDSLSKESPMVISTAYAYAKNYVMYGEDITKAWTTLVQQASILEKIKVKAKAEAYDYFKKDYENCLKNDMVAMLTELMVDIGDHIMPSNHTDSYDDGWSEGAEWCVDYIQEKINALKENKDAI